ncbi:hypothetical protein [Xenorhabdus thailandensis]
MMSGHRFRQDIQLNPESVGRWCAWHPNDLQLQWDVGVEVRAIAGKTQ